MGLIGIIVGYTIGTNGALRINAVPPVPNAPIAPDAPAPSAPVPPVSREDHVRGNRRARVSVIEYSDFECPFCKRHHPTMQQILRTYGDDVNWVYRHFPLTSIHPNAQKAAEAAECAADQGGNEVFWTYADALFAAEGLSREVFDRIARDLQLDLEEFRTCLDDGTFADAVADQMAAGAAAGVQGTPANFVVRNADGESRSVDGAQPFESFKSVIDEQLQ